MEKNYFGAIEFGSLYINILVVSYNNNKFDVVANCKVPSTGFSNGKIIDEESLNKSLINALGEIKDKYKVSIDELVLVLPANEHKIYSAKVSNKVLTERQIIGKLQIDSIRNSIKNAKVSENEVLVYEVPTMYYLDDNRQLRTAPINYQSSTISISSNIHTLPKEIVYPLFNILKENNIRVIGQYINCNCGAIATAKNYDLEDNCIHISIGQDSTTISGFKKNLLIKSISIDFGLLSLVDYLKNNLNISLNYACKLFESYFICDNEYASDIIFDEENNISEKRINGIILNRLYVAFNKIIENIKLIISECEFADDVKYLVTGLLNDYEFFVSEFAKYSSYDLNEGLIDIVGIPDQSYLNCYGALIMYLEDNYDKIIYKIENDDQIELNEINLNQNDNTNLNKSGRFQDIFDD